MNNIKEIAFTCYPVVDMVRARKFYEEIIGLKPDLALIENSGGMWVEYSFGGGTFSLGKMDGFNPAKDGASMAIEVEDFEGMVKKLQENKITFTMGPIETPVCYMVMFQDTEGNSLMIHKRK